MNEALVIFAVQGALGAFDTLYFHEWRARLPSLEPGGRRELRLHGLRSLVYAVLFGTLPWTSWRGWLAPVLAALIALEIALTMADFAIEDDVRAPRGGVPPGERVTHGLMAVVYGAALARLAPEVLRWWSLPTGFGPGPAAPAPLRLVLAAMAVGVLASALRDLAASVGLPGSAWPWGRPR